MDHYPLEAAATSLTKTPITPVRSRPTPWSVGLIGAIGLTASLLASVTTWPVVTDLSYAISTGDAAELLRVIGMALIEILRVLVRYL